MATSDICFWSTITSTDWNFHHLSNHLKTIIVSSVKYLLFLNQYSPNANCSHSCKGNLLPKYTTGREENIVAAGCLQRGRVSSLWNTVGSCRRNAKEQKTAISARHWLTVYVANGNKLEAVTLVEGEGKDHKGWSTGMPLPAHKAKL